MISEYFTQVLQLIFAFITDISTLLPKAMIKFITKKKKKNKKSFTVSYFMLNIDIYNWCYFRAIQKISKDTIFWFWLFLSFVVQIVRFRLVWWTFYETKYNCAQQFCGGSCDYNNELRTFNAITYIMLKWNLLTPHYFVHLQGYNIYIKKKKKKKKKTPYLCKL